MSRTIGHKGKRFLDIKKNLKCRGKERIRASDRENIKNIMNGYDPDSVVWMKSGKYSADWWYD